MFVSTLNLEEFRGIRKCQAPIDLSSITVLIGRNNSGKSTILEALSLLPNPHIKDYVIPEKKEKIILNRHRPNSKNNKPLIYAYAGKATIEYTINGKSWKLLIEENTSTIFIDEKEISNLVKISKEVGVSEEDLSKVVFFMPNDTSYTERIEKSIDSLKDLIIKNGNHVKIAEHISKCIDDKYTEVIFVSPISMRKEISSKKPIYIPLRDLGDGIEKAVKIMLLIDVIHPKLLLLDDFESSFHPSLIRILLNWLKKRNWQIVLSTHSIDVLYELLEIRPANAIVLQLKKTADGLLTHRSLNLNELEDFINAHSDPRLLVDAIPLQ